MAGKGSSSLSIRLDRYEELRRASEQAGASSMAAFGRKILYAHLDGGGGRVDDVERLGEAVVSAFSALLGVLLTHRQHREQALGLLDRYFPAGLEGFDARALRASLGLFLEELFAVLLTDEGELERARSFLAQGFAS